MKNKPTAGQARISEIFSSLQGEGTHLGEKHLFIRFEECHIHCTYCDELDKIGHPMTIEAVVSEANRLEAVEGPHGFVSLTGGEPLLYLDFLKPLITALKKKNFRIYLETNGILWKALAEVIQDIDLVAMDMKPASVTGEKNFDDDHRRFLEIAKQKETFIKIIISRELVVREFEEQLEIVRNVAPNTPVVLVPISGAIEGHEDPELMSFLQQLQALGMKKIPSVRIVPRFHKILNIR